jgi:starch-binding outer membrane protein, SusD/RagB family
MFTFKRKLMQYLTSISKNAILLTTLSLLMACEKYVEVNPPETQIESVVLFRSDAAATAAVTGLYSRMTAGNLFLTNGAMTLYPGLSADELTYTATSTELSLFLTNSLQVDNSTGNAGRIWRAAYQYIYHANAVLEGITGSTGMTDSVKAQLRGEMLLTRSLVYFYLMNLYGDIPFQEATDYHVNQLQSRTPAATVYSYLVRDLLEAKALLKTSYVVSNRTRPNQRAAAALLARVYLYGQNWEGAEAEASLVIQSGTYSLPTNLAAVFVIASPETIWQLGRDDNNTGEGVSFIPTSTTVRPAYVLQPLLVNAFENGDKRKASWISKNTVSGVDYFYPAKYKVRVETPISEYYVVLRLAEQYLIRSEARARQNNLSGAKADLDMIRSRAGLPGTTANAAATLSTALEAERRVELFAEWGHRWFDLKRWNRANAVLGPLKAPNWQPSDALYPIPLKEMQTNPSLTQNPGY